MPDIFDSTNKEKSAAENLPQHTVKELKKSTPVKTHKAKHKWDNQGRHNFPGHSHNPFASYSYLPDRVNFVNEDPEEKVILMLRKHPVTNLGWMTVSFLMIIAPAFVTVLTPLGLLPAGYQFVLTLVWYLITSAFILEEFLKWFFHVNLVTDERIIEVDFVNLVYREITDANIDQIQDVTVEVGGALRTFLHYGNVIIQTAAQVPKIEFEVVPNPDAVAKLLRELRIEEEKEKLEGRVR
jgi:membrane protein YdbS with pleckstrin-like domain